MKLLNYLIVTITLFVSMFTQNAMAFAKIDVTQCSGVYRNSPNNSAPGLQTCINNAGSEAAIYFPPGYYTIASTITVSNNNVTLFSDSRSSAQLKFTGCGDLIKFSKVGIPMYNGGVKGIWLLGDGHCAQTALHFVDGSWFSVEDLQISGPLDSPGFSTGIQTNGREGFNIRNLFIAADNPIVISKNPNHAYLDADHFHFQNIYSSILNGGSHHITMDPTIPITVTNMLIDGQNPMAGGCGILKWIQPSVSASVSYHLKISNIRHEQLAEGCDKQIDIELKTPLQGLIIDNVSFQADPFPPLITAIKVDMVDGMTVRNTSYYNPNSTASLQGTFINAKNIKYIQLENNSYYPYSKNIIATDRSGAALVWKAGPYTGKECCYQETTGGPWIRTPDSGILGQP